MREFHIYLNKKRKSRENLLYSGFFCRGGSWNKNQRKRKERQVFRSCQRTKKKSTEHEGNGDTNCNWCAWNGPPKGSGAG